MVLHLAALSCPKLLGQLTEHLAQWLGLALDLACILMQPLAPTSSRPLAPDPVDSCRPLGLCHPALHGPDSSWDCRHVLHKTPPNELD